jgi:hypothetical protein
VRPLSRMLAVGFLLLILMASLVNLGSIVEGVHVALTVTGSLLAQLGTLVLLAVATFTYAYFAYVRPSNRPARRVDVELLPLERAKKLQAQALGTRFTNIEQAQLFALSILEPQEVRQRVVESYTPGSRSVRQKVSVEFRVPEQLIASAKLEALRHLYVPIMVPLKGRMQDQFDLYDDSGQAVSVLTYREYLQLSAQVIRLLLRAAYPNGGSLDLPDDVRQAELSALATVMQRRNQAGIVVDVTGRSGWKELEKLSAATDRVRRVRDIAARLARKLSTHYALVAVVPVEGSRRRFLLKYEQTLIPTLKLTGIRKRVGIALGTRPVKLTIDLNNASTCQSFHLRITGEEGTYLGSQQLIDAENTLRGRQRSDLTPPHYRFRKRLGQPYAHFYSRYFPDSALRTPVAGSAPSRERPRVSVQFFEVPPGSMIRAAASAIASLLLILAVGWVISDKPNPGTDVPAILLAFPAVVGTWLGFESPSRRLLEGTLTSRLSLVATVALSVVASAYYMALNSIGPRVAGPYYSSGVSILGVANVNWSILVGLAAINASVVSFRYGVRVWEYSALSRRAIHHSDIEQDG